MYNRGCSSVGRAFRLQRKGLWFESILLQNIHLKSVCIHVMDTYNTKYGKLTLLSNENIIGTAFKDGVYWEEGTILKLKQFIDPNKNILEIGGHCGSASLMYASFLNDGKVYVYEPQKRMYELLIHNIRQNDLHHKIIPFNQGVFCYTGAGTMHESSLDCGGGLVDKRHTSERDLGCNFGGICLGSGGESVDLTTIDAMGHTNIGFIHCDAQGAENFIFSGGIETISRDRPNIYYENNQRYGCHLYENVCKTYPQYSIESKFDIGEYCITHLDYLCNIHQYNNTDNTLVLR